MALPPRLPASPAADTSFTLPKKVFRWVQPTAVWTGIGAAGAFLVGVVFFNDAANFGRWFGAFLIIFGVVVMKLSSGN